jgi:hypothetical protein
MCRWPSCAAARPWSAIIATAAQTAVTSPLAILVVCQDFCTAVMMPCSPASLPTPHVMLRRISLKHLSSMAGRSTSSPHSAALSHSAQSLFIQAATWCMPRMTRRSIWDFPEPASSKSIPSPGGWARHHGVFSWTPAICLTDTTITVALIVINVLVFLNRRLVTKWRWTQSASNSSLPVFPC